MYAYGGGIHRVGGTSPHGVGPVHPQFPAAIAKSLMLMFPLSLMSPDSSGPPQAAGTDDPTGKPAIPNSLRISPMSRMLILPSPVTSPTSLTSPPCRVVIPASITGGPG